MSDNAPYTRIFVAYASEDQKAHDTLCAHLNVLKKEIPITIWSAANLMPGTKIEEDTQTELQRADIVLLLVSTDSLNSEAYANIQSQVQDSTIFVPVLLRPCMWESDPFLKNLQALPKNRQFISTSENQEEVYLDIVKEVRGMVTGESEDKSISPPKKKPYLWIVTTLVVMLLTGLAWFWNKPSDKSNTEDRFVKVIDKDTIISSTEVLPSEKPIFIKEDTLFKILVIRFEDDRNKDGDTYCIGRAIRKNLVELEKIKGLPIKSEYEDKILSPDHPDKAKKIQEYHNADLLLYGIANKIQEYCEGANMCFQRIIADTIMANVAVPDYIEGERYNSDKFILTIEDLEEGNYSLDDISMENLVRGLIDLKNNDYDAAIVHVDKMLGDTSGLANGEIAIKYFNRGITYAKLKEYKKAITDYNKAIELKSDYAEAYYNRGFSYANLKEYKKAITDYDKAIKLKSDYAGAYYNRGFSYANLSPKPEYKKAIADYDKEIELWPYNATAYNNRGLCYGKLRKDKKAIADYGKAIELKPDDATPYYNRGNTYAGLNEYKKAMVDYDKAIELKPDDDIAYYNRGTAYYALKEYKKAIADYDKAIELKIDFPMIYNNRAYAHLRLNQFEKAKKDLQKSEKLDTKNIWVYRNWSIYYTTQNDFTRAIQNVKKVVELGCNCKQFLQEEELLAPLRSHPEWQQIIESIDDKNSEK